MKIFVGLALCAASFLFPVGYLAPGLFCLALGIIIIIRELSRREPDSN